jgi:HAE1 family hydrophobic/amphiphilic exporter-1
VVVNNAIIMIDFYLQRISPEHDRTSTIIFVAGIRLRPILITTLTTILGMLPIAMAMGDGGNIIQPLGISVAGGLLISTFFTLFMVPVILNLLGERIKAPQNKDESSAE